AAALATTAIDAKRRAATTSKSGAAKRGGLGARSRRARWESDGEGNADMERRANRQRRRRSFSRDEPLLSRALCAKWSFMKAKVAALKVNPQTILSDIERLTLLADMPEALSSGATTILKDNISWHYPFPGANTTPWQMEGTILALQKAGFSDITCVQNKTVVTNAFKGEDLNHYLPLFKKYDVPVLYNFKESDMRWVEYRPKAQMHVLHRIFPDGILVPE